MNVNYTDIVKKQRDFFNSNQTKNIDFRIGQLKKLKSLVRQYEPELYKAIYNDYRKSEFDTYANELSFVYHEINEIIKKLHHWSRRKRVTTNLINIPARSYIVPEPLGVCLVIGAWNYPYLISLVPSIAAIGAGNTVVIKPSEIPSATSAIMAKMINENFPPEHFVVLEGGVKETTEILEQKFDKIFFTGSTNVGRIIYQAAAKHLTPVTLEMGGKSPAIVTRNTNLKDTAKRIIWAKFLNSGQTCITLDYVLVDETIKDELLSYFKDYIVKFDYSFENNNYVQIINDRNFQRLMGLMDTTKIYYGGQSNAEQRFIAPTIMRDVTFDDKVMSEEIFGPILPVITYKDLDEAIQKIKSLPKPLSCYVFTNDDKVKTKILNELSFGGGAFNDPMMHISNHHLPFGGVGESGFGSHRGAAGFKTFSHYKSILDKPFWLETKLKYPPYNSSKLAWLRRLLEM